MLTVLHLSRAAGGGRSTLAVNENLDCDRQSVYCLDPETAEAILLSLDRHIPLPWHPVLCQRLLADEGSGG